MPISKSKADRCVTHHCCDCHQYGIEQMEDALLKIIVWTKSYHHTQEQMVLELIMNKAEQAMEWRKHHEA